MHLTHRRLHLYAADTRIQSMSFDPIIYCGIARKLHEQVVKNPIHYDPPGCRSLVRKMKGLLK
jgi:hypothetical protein